MNQSSSSGQSSQDEVITFFERGVTDFICSIALRRYECFGSAARWISYRTRNDPFAVLSDGSRIHREVSW